MQTLLSRLQRLLPTRCESICGTGIVMTIAKSLVSVFRQQENSPHPPTYFPHARARNLSDEYLTNQFRERIIGKEQQTYASLYFIFADYSGLRWRSFNEPVPLHPDYVRKVIYGR
jgi:hypothetical protein